VAQLHPLKQNILDCLEIDPATGSKILDYQFKVVSKMAAENNVRAIWLNILRLECFLNDITVVKRCNLQAFNKIKRDLVNSKDNDNFFGFRFEAYIGCRLCRSSVSFSNQESPDFVIHDYENTYLECNSLHSRGGRSSQDDFDKKLVDGLQRKESKPYAKTNCVLLIDMTNIFYNTDPNLWQEAVKSHEHIITVSADPKKYGSIILLRQSASQNHNHIEYSSDRIDSKYIDSNLVAFLDDHFKHPGVTINASAIPREG